MAIILQFIEKELAKAENTYSRVQASPEQKIVIDQLAELLSKHTGMPKLPMKGFLWKAMRDWQLKHNTACHAVLELPYAERLKKVAEMLTILEENYLSKVLKNSIDQYRLKRAIDAAFTHYQSIAPKW